MKKIIYTLILISGIFLFQINIAKAQYGVGSNVLNLGVGFGDYGGGFAPGVSGSFDHGMSELGPGVFGLGAIVGYEHSTYYYYGGVDGFSYSVLFVGVRGTWHPDFSSSIDPKKVDLYIAVDLGVVIVSASDLGNRIYGYESSAGGFGGGLMLGGRYFFSSSIAGFGEIGYEPSVGYLKLGISFNLAGR